jgi:hypothetical protein
MIRVDSSRLRSTLLLSGIAIIVAALYARFGLLVHQTAVNLPIWDDFDSVLFFLNQYIQTDSLNEKLSLIFSQHNEHRIVINHLLTLVSYWCFGEVNFLFLIWCAVFALLTVPFVIASSMTSTLSALVIATAVLLQPQYGDGLNWVTTCLASFSLVLLAALCGRIINQPNTWWLLSFPLSAITCFGQGNGIALPLCLGFALLINGYYRRAGLVALWSVIVVTLYFHGYHFSERAQRIPEMIAQYPTVLEYGFTLVGASLGFSDVKTSMWVGVVLTIITIGLFCQRRFRANTTLVTVILFLFLSAALNTAARSLSGAQWAISPGRYTIISSGIITCVSLGLIIVFQRYSRSLNITFGTLALAFNLCSYDRYRYAVEDLYIRALNDFALYVIFGEGLTYPWPDRGVPIFETSLKNGVFSLPLDDLALGRIVPPPPSRVAPPKGQARIGINRVQKGKSYLVIEGWGFLKQCSSADTHLNLLFHGKDEQIAIEPLRKKRSDVGEIFHSEDRIHAGFLGIIPLSTLKEEEMYRLNLLISCNGAQYTQSTRYSVSRTEILGPQRD